MIDEFIASHRQINLAKLLKVLTLCNHRVGIPDFLKMLSSYEGKDEEVRIMGMMKEFIYFFRFFNMIICRNVL